MDAIIVALITGGCSVVGVIITTLTTSRRTEQKMATAQAVTDTKNRRAHPRGARTQQLR